MTAARPALHVVILAAGQGTRMRSRLPKVLQLLGGQPLLAHVLERARDCQPTHISIVVGHQAEQVQARFPDPDLRFVLQAEQRGTGHAVALALEQQPPDSQVLVLYGDVPLLAPLDIQRCLHSNAPLTLLTADIPDPTGYGRILLGPEGQVLAIVEEREADAATRLIQRINTGILTARAADLLRWLPLAEVKAQQAGHEWYLTDVVALAHAEGLRVEAVLSSDANTALGVNHPLQLATQERLLQRRRASACLQQGLQLADPERFDLRGTLTFGQDCRIDVNCLCEGEVVLGHDVSIGPGCVLRNVHIGDHVVIAAYSVLESCVIGNGCHIGPYARLRPDTVLDDQARIGNFVEVKNSHLHSGAKVNHLSYIGDAEIGARSNVGAGTITCNYDGVNKHRTLIGEGAFIGSNTALVAPVSVGAGATIGAGSVITRTAPAHALTLTRAEQITRLDWQSPQLRSKEKP